MFRKSGINSASKVLVATLLSCGIFFSQNCKSEELNGEIRSKEEQYRDSLGDKMAHCICVAGRYEGDKNCEILHEYYSKPQTDTNNPEMKKALVKKSFEFYKEHCSEVDPKETIKPLQHIQLFSEMIVAYSRLSDTTDMDMLEDLIDQQLKAFFSV